MDFSNIANLMNAVARSAGVIFAAVQIRQYQRWRKRGDDPMLELVRSFQALRSLRRCVVFFPCPMALTRQKYEKSSGRMVKMRFIWSRLPGKVSAFWFSAAR